MVGMRNICPVKTPELLQCMPGAPSEISAWFDTLTDQAFDTVCVSAVTVMLREEQDESGFISATSIARCTRAVRDRYRQVPGKRFHTKLNEWQVRIARRMDRRVTSTELAELFNVNASTIRHARNGATWRNLLNGNSLRNRSLRLNQHRA